MTVLDTVCQTLSQIAPLRLAESWDNVGLLVGDRSRKVQRVMTCLTITPGVVDEAVAKQADLVVAHHPLPFKPLQKITSDSITGTMLLKLIENNTAIYSAHTAFDSAVAGINQRWAESFSLVDVAPLVDPVAPNELGAGRVGRLPSAMSLEELVRQAATLVGATAPRRVGLADKPVLKVGFACGSGGSFLSSARKRGCDALITGEATFHTCLEAESTDIGLGLLGHYWSERFAMERLAETLSSELDGLTIWPSERESDPLAAVTL